MSADYFSLLAARTLGTAPRLGPIVPARFEPVRHRIPFDEVSKERLLPAVPRPAAAMPRLGMTPPDTAAPPADGSTAPLMTEERPTRRPNERPPVQPQPTIASSTPAPGAATLRTQVTRVAPDQTGSDALMASHADDAAPTSTGVPIDFDPFEDVRPPVSRSIPPPPARRRQMEAAGGDPEASAMAPTVIVRIGRVDVRAVSNPSPPPTASDKRAPARPSLADHLRARDEGRR